MVCCGSRVQHLSATSRFQSPPRVATLARRLIGLLLFSTEINPSSSVWCDVLFVILWLELQRGIRDLGLSTSSTPKMPQLQWITCTSQSCLGGR
jgi:hypothetical protein